MQQTADETTRRVTVLIVDDERALRATLRAGLVERGYDVLEATNVEVAQRVLRARDSVNDAIDIVIADVRLPGGPDGTELAIWLYRFLPDVILILTSGYFERAEATAGPLVHGHRLPKPFRPSEAIALIEQCLAQRAADRARIEDFRFPPWE